MSERRRVRQREKNERCKRLSLTAYAVAMTTGTTRFIHRLRLLALSPLLLLCFAADAPNDRVQILLNPSEAERVLDILAKRKAGKPVTEDDWQALFATEPYQRLKKREASMHRQFTEDDFKKFVLSDDLAKEYDVLTRTLAEWKKVGLHASGARVLQYLPAKAVIHAKVFPEIKPLHNSFVFDVGTDPAIFLYLDPGVSRQYFEQTVAHEMHHIGLASTDKEYEKKISSLPDPARKVAQWMGAFGEGEAMLAAAGGPDVPINEYATEDLRTNWQAGMRDFNENLATVNDFFVQVLDGRIAGDEINKKAFSFFGLQGPWYTVGYKMAVMVEKRYGRPALIECMLDRRLLLSRYNSAADETNRGGKEHLGLWSPEVLKAVGTAP